MPNDAPIATLSASAVNARSCNEAIRAVFCENVELEIAFSLGDIDDLKNVIGKHFDEMFKPTGCWSLSGLDL